MQTVPNRQAMCEKLMELAQTDRDIMVLTSDSRGSAAMAPFVKQFPEQFVETGIAEQNIVGIASGLAPQWQNTVRHITCLFPKYAQH